MASLRERIGRSSRNSTKPPSRDGPGFMPPEQRKHSGRKGSGRKHSGCKRGGQPGHPGSGPELLVIEHRLYRLVCSCCSTSTCATLPAEVEAGPYGPGLSALVGLLGSAFPLSFSKTQALLDHLLGVEISRGAIASIGIGGGRSSCAGDSDGVGSQIGWAWCGAVAVRPPPAWRVGSTPRSGLDLEGGGGRRS